jgi:hypothetical protein
MAGNEALIQDILRQIQRCEEQITAIQAGISQLSCREEQIREAQRRNGLKRDEFAGTVLSQRNKTDYLREANQIRLASSYAETMTEMVVGNPFSNTFAAFDEVDAGCQQAFQRINDDIHHRQSAIGTLKREIEQLRLEMYRGLTMG